MKNLKILVLLFWAASLQLHAQFTTSNFEKEVLAYQPEQRANVILKDYERGSFILNETKKATKNKSQNFSYADYWNLTMSFIYLDEPTAHIEMAFQKAIDQNPLAICEYVESFGEKSVRKLTRHIPDVFLPFYKKCQGGKAVKTKLDLQNNSPQNGLDESLVHLIQQIGAADQKYRKHSPVDWSKQRPLDMKNMALIDSLFQVYQCYLGESLVGKELSATMWAVIQHSNIEKMEMYLPIVHQAVQAGELNATPLKMLIDRIYCIRENVQPFGSQYGNDCALMGAEQRAVIEGEYGLE